MKAPNTASLAIADNVVQEEGEIVDKELAKASDEVAKVDAPAPAAPEAPATAPESAAAPVAPTPEGDGDAPTARDESAPLEVSSEESVQALRPCDLSIKPIEDSELLSVTHLPSGEVREMTREELNQLLRG